MALDQMYAEYKDMFISVHGSCEGIDIVPTNVAMELSPRDERKEYLELNISEEIFQSEAH